jgi:acyl-coenzyme A synthetase/AMP-(fatty) acid ligase
MDQLAAAAALLHLDGLARRIVLYPPDMSREHLPFVAETAGADVVVRDDSAPVGGREGRPVGFQLEYLASSNPGQQLVPSEHSEDQEWDAAETGGFETEWILLTSGTTGRPKLVVHTLRTLTGAIEPAKPGSAGIVWSTFYDIRRYGGLQIFLRAALTGTGLVLTGAGESTAEFLMRAGEAGVTHISGTPSHWRRALMHSAAGSIRPPYVRLSGEITDGAVLEQLRRNYPDARIAHAFASTEAGVAFEVGDGAMGVPVYVLQHTPGVEMKIEGGTLRIRSARTACCYLGQGSPRLKDTDGFVDTGDVLELRDGRYYFAGRLDGTINVGGQKVHPEEVEAVINGHPQVSMSLVRNRKSPITGSVVIADVVLKTPIEGAGDTQAMQQQILAFCRGALARHKVPASINFVPGLEVAETGKLVRRHA